MRAYLNRDNMIVLRAETLRDEQMLETMSARGHVHFVCKALIRGERTRLRTRARLNVRLDTDKALRLFLAPSVIRWRRPLRGLGSAPVRRKKFVDKG